MGKRKEMDKLSQDSCDALKAGMSYGKYMAMKGSTNATQQTNRKGNYHVCQFCGEKFSVPHKIAVKYCSERCRWSSYYAPKIKTVTKICETCGNEFVTTKSQQKFCSEDCRRNAEKKRLAEAKKKEEVSNE